MMKKFVKIFHKDGNRNLQIIVINAGNAREHELACAVADDG